ncbi:MAG: hypothetical protein P8L39_12255 [Halioglobus sp.]|nr:hypothetical protein [Halioglobus sp.]
MSDDDLNHIPPIVPTRDGGLERNNSNTALGAQDRSRRPNDSKQPAAKSSASVLARLTAIAALIAAVIVCVWGWQVQAQLALANAQIADYAARIADLEDRLSDTDEGMNQNAAVQAVKVASLETEVRKLWDNVWKQSKERLGKLETVNAAQGKSIKGLEAALASAELELAEVANDAARVKSNVNLTQAEVERVADSLNRIDLAVTRLDKRVATNQEAVDSIDAFRKQVNSSLSQLRSTLRATP